MAKQEMVKRTGVVSQTHPNGPGHISFNVINRKENGMEEQIASGLIVPNDVAPITNEVVTVIVLRGEVL